METSEQKRTTRTKRERSQWRCPVSLMLTLNIFHGLLWFFYNWLWTSKCRLCNNTFYFPLTTFSSPVYLKNSHCRGTLRTLPTSRIERFVKIINGWMPLFSSNTQSWMFNRVLNTPLHRLGKKYAQVTTTSKNFAQTMPKLFAQRHHLILL